MARGIKDSCSGCDYATVKESYEQLSEYWEFKGWLNGHSHRLA